MPRIGCASWPKFAPNAWRPVAPPNAATGVVPRQPGALGLRSAAIGLTVATIRHAANAPYCVPNFRLSATTRSSFEK